ncbi:type II toxin-antitoxin system RelE/ParE family toxin [Methylorubrum populi]|uniref:type II toxin-antitoxin system RelE/ParE family toxin n=1 Tax=Methylorubrum rhodesianum TaxID=29427 RepID=UPI00190DDCCD|nr:type II toxin-antitoxin system RelE/ParE family toxin [Methylorubrum rhodesianum]MBK3404166.1 type II toxin-antitoxin system RelE/ParE family toxin [Methylorubrum rhodesianum]MBY0142956.1 type II toxin-antitoxin system RelE/ParE family toxin [Methylorubrum populi]
MTSSGGPRVPHRLTRRADGDIERILDETRSEFGTHQLLAYSNYIDRAIAMVADTPRRPSSKERPELGPGIRSFQVALATGRRRGASHVLFYQVTEGFGDEDDVVILRVLPERMEPRPRLTVDLDVAEEEDANPAPGP